jgi:uncharacterized membrane protein
MSLVIVGIALLFWPLLPGAVSGFLVVGPILATGLYALSRRQEQGQAPSLRDVFYAWRCALRPACGPISVAANKKPTLRLAFYIKANSS